MIIPFLQGIVQFHKAPVTWALIAINVLVYMNTNHDIEFQNKEMVKVLKDEKFQKTQGQIYAQFIDKYRDQYTPFYSGLADQALSGQSERIEVLARLALKDPNFLKQAPWMEFTGDRVAFDWWKKKLVELKKIKLENPSYVMGVTSENTGWMQWLSYQFVHSDKWHLFGNMIFLLIFGGALELVVGGMGLISIYFTSGVLAALVFVILSGLSTTPLIGASGSIMGIMTFYCMLAWKRPVKFVWIIGLTKDYMGFIYLPAWFAFVMFFISDLGGYLGEVQELGGIAYSAHLGGQLAGCVGALVLYALRYGKTPILGRSEELKFLLWKKESFFPPQ